MKQTPFQKWLQHPTYFMFWILVGLASWSISFQESSTPEPIQMSSLAQNENSQSEDFIDENVEEVQDTNYSEIQSMSDEELLQRLLASGKNKPPVEGPDREIKFYALTDQEIEEIEHPAADSVYAGLNFHYQEISDSTIKFELENPKDSKVCPPARLFYEKQLTANNKTTADGLVSKLIQRRLPESESLSRMCIIHIMNKMGLSGRNLGICHKAVGAVKTGGAKPCVTEAIVNATYNSYVDVMECLNLNPKLFLPKISRESGFLVNAYGTGKDGGIGQFTQPAIESVNRLYPAYMKQIELAAATKPSCARLLEHKTLLKPAPTSSIQRCSMIAAPENPIKNVLYIGLFNRLHMDMYSGMKFVAGKDMFERNGQLVEAFNDSRDEFEGEFKRRNFKQNLEALGIKNPNMHYFKELLTIAGYNMGSPTALRLMDSYLEKRIRAKKPLTKADFDFNIERNAVDTDGDGNTKNVIEIARSYVMSSFISPKDTAAQKAIKLKKRKEFPKRWAASYLRSFPEYLAYNANAYDGKMIGKFEIYGAPGYASYVASRNQEFRKLFKNANIDPDLCSDPEFLKFE